MQEHNQPAGGWDAKAARKAMNQEIYNQCGVPNAVKAIYDYRIYLDYDKIDSAGADMSKVKEAAIKTLRKNDELVAVVDYEKISEASIPEILKQRLIKGRGNIKFNEIEFSVCGFPSESFAEFIERFFVVGARGVGVRSE